MDSTSKPDSTATPREPRFEDVRALLARVCRLIESEYRLQAVLLEREAQK
jgi:hypothetical protein